MDAADRFLADSSLEFLARRLRVLGYDVEVARDADLEGLFREAERRERRVLTTSRRHPRRFASVPATVVPRDPRAAVRIVAGSYRPAGAPFSRCSACNGVLERRPAATSGAPPRIRATFEAVEHCARCGRWYWPGSHVERLRRWIEAAL